MSDLIPSGSTNRIVTQLVAQAAKEVLRCPIELNDESDPRIPSVLAQVHPPGADEPPPWALPAPLNLSEVERRRLTAIHAGSDDVPAGFRLYVDTLEACYNGNAYARAVFCDGFDTFRTMLQHNPDRINLPELETALAKLGPKRGPLRTYFEHLQVCDDRASAAMAGTGFRPWPMGPGQITSDKDRWAGNLPGSESWRGEFIGGDQVWEVYCTADEWARFLRSWLRGHSERGATVLFHCGPDAVPAIPELRQAAQRLKRAGSPGGGLCARLLEGIIAGDLREILDGSGLANVLAVDQVDNSGLKTAELGGSDATNTARPEVACPEPGQALTLEERAIGMFSKHPELTKAEMARRLGCSRTSLYRMKRLTMAIDAVKAGRSELPRGRKDPDTGDIEAWD